MLRTGLLVVAQKYPAAFYKGPPVKSGVAIAATNDSTATSTSVPEGANRLWDYSTSTGTKRR